MRKIVREIAFLLICAAVLAASSEAAKIEFSVTAFGNISSITESQREVQNCTFINETNSTECTNQTISENITNYEPWQKSVTIEIECESICSYPIPSFNAPKNAEINKYILSSNSNVFFESTESKTTKNPEDKIVVKVEQPKKISELVFDRILPSVLNEGVSQTNLFIRNNGTDAVSYLNATLIGSGINEAFVESYSKLDAGELGIVPITLNISGSGQKDLIVKISWRSDDKIYSTVYQTKIIVNASPKKQVEQVNSTEVKNRFEADKEKLKGYEIEYAKKRSEGYLVSEVYDSIKNAKDYVESVQLLIEEGKFSDAKLKLALLELALDDIDNGLRNALKTQQTWADKLKNNALLISVIVTAIAGLTTLYERHKMRMMKIKEKLAGKIKDKKQQNVEQKEKKQASKKQKKQEDSGNMAADLKSPP